MGFLGKMVFLCGSLGKMVLWFGFLGKRVLWCWFLGKIVFWLGIWVTCSFGVGFLALKCGVFGSMDLLVLVSW